MATFFMSLFKTAYFKQTIMNGTFLFLSIMTTYIISLVISYNIGYNKRFSILVEEYEDLHKKYIKALEDHAQFIRDLRK